MTDIKEKLSAFSRRFNDCLPEFFTLPAGPEKRVVQAMEYSVMNGGKRLRPFLVCECAALFGVPEEKSFRTAVALEMLHSSAAANQPATSSLTKPPPFWPATVC